ncbi:MAG TPA: hypothetical protein VND93_16140 [Myxococcales bacterium]|nr:hypothetical protein [Myxococcales bacterium]
MRTRSPAALALALAPALLLLGCNFPVNDKVAVPPDLSLTDGRQFVMPETIIPAGSEKMFCWIPGWVPDQDYLLTSLEPLQGTYGHHLLAMVSAIPREAGTVFDCTDAEQMASLRPLVIPDRGDQAALLPPGFAVKLSAGSKVVFQSHYVNTSEHDLAVADVARLHFPEPGSTPVEAGYFILNSTGIDLAPGQTGQVTVSCSPPQQLRALLWEGHMHYYGRSISLKRTRGGTTDTIYSVDTWQPQYRDLPPVTTYPTSSPLVVEPTDTYTLTCNYDNQTDYQVRFPTEMCAAVSYYYPALPEALVLCN